MNHLNNHLLCAIDIETSGLKPGYHDIVQIAILPLDFKIQPHLDIVPFVLDLRPKNPDNADLDNIPITRKRFQEFCDKGFDPHSAIDLFDMWFQNLNMATHKRIIALAHNWPFDRSFIIEWLGNETFNYCFDGRYRDTMVAANFINDCADFKNEPIPFPKVNLRYLTSQLKIEHEKAHDALHDCVATARVYKEMLFMGHQ